MVIIQKGRIMDTKMRYKILDIIRGITLIEMIAYHGIWDLVYVFGWDFSWFKQSGAYLWQQSICWTFILLSGFCWSMGKKKIKRGATVFLCGCAITVVTVLVMPGERIVFGVLTLLGTAMLLMIPLDKILKKVKGEQGMIISLLLFVVFRNVNQGYLGFEEWSFFKLPKVWYQNYITAFWGFPGDNFFSTDYFSLFPWIFLFLTGYFLYQWMQQKEKLKILNNIKINIPVVEWMGRNSLIVYMLHQPMVYGILYLGNMLA